MKHNEIEAANILVHLKTWNITNFMASTWDSFLMPTLCPFFPPPYTLWFSFPSISQTFITHVCFPGQYILKSRERTLCFPSTLQNIPKLTASDRNSRAVPCTVRRLPISSVIC